MKRLLSLIIAAALLFALAACGMNSYPVEMDEMEALCNIDDSYIYYIRTYSDPKNLTGRFISKDADKPEIQIFADAKTDKTLEEFGQSQAEMHNVFCNMMGDTAVLNYYLGGRFVQDYIAERNNVFFTFSYVYKPEKHTVSGSDMSFLLPAGYTGTTDADSAFEHEVDYAPNSESFPDLSVRSFAKDYFTADRYDANVFTGTTKKQFASYAKDGWTLDEWLKLYGENHELVRGEIMKRNGLDLAFIAFVEDGIFNVRAVIDDGDGYLLLCARDDAASFQHVTNAIIDTISK